MATTTTTQTRRRNGGTPDETTELGLEATRNAQEALLRSLRAGADTALTFADVQPGELILYEDAYRNLALALNRGSAAEALELMPGDELVLRPGD